MRRFQKCGFLAALLLAVACTPRQEVVIETDGRTGTLAGNQTVALGSDGYPGVERSELRRRLAAAGYSVTPAGQAELEVSFSLTIGEPRTVVYEQRYPEFEKFERFVEINGELKSFEEDIFVGYRTETFPETAYQARAVMTISSAASSGQTLAERRAETDGPCGKPEILGPKLLDALLGTESGGTVRVELPDCR